ncbi:MAG TPA: hypothetical protein VKV77_09835 [Methylovirgula sp.]|nr:hypothetical protein [Methylovirgula sp.]
MKWRVFLREERGSSFESMALAMSVIAVLFVATADLLHYAAKKDGTLARMFANTQIARLRGEVDYTPTGSLIGLRQAPRLDPCTGK